MIRRILLRRVNDRVFPYFILPGMVREYFEFVDSGFDFCVLPIINEKAELEKREKAYWGQYIDNNSRLVVVNTLDEYYSLSPFNQDMVDICEQCEVVFGHQLPVDGSHHGFTPIFYPPLVQALRNSSYGDISEEIDLCFCHRL